MMKKTLPSDIITTLNDWQLMALLEFFEADRIRGIDEITTAVSLLGLLESLAQSRGLS